MSDHSPEPQKGILPAFIAVIGVFAIFLFLLVVAQKPLRPLEQVQGVDEENAWRQTETGRQEKLAELRGREKQTATNYAWIDKDSGTVQIPIDRAIELTIAELKSQQ